MQADAAPPRSIELDDDMAFQRRNWRAERIGWAAMALLLIAAALGLFATGPLSSTRARGEAGTASVEYERLQRQTAPATMKVKVAPSGVAADGITIEIDEAFANAFRITEIWPPPVQSTAIAGGMRFRFDATQNAPATIHFHLSPETIGLVRAGLMVGGRDRIALPTFIYP